MLKRIMINAVRRNFNPNSTSKHGALHKDARIRSDLDGPYIHHNILAHYRINIQQRLSISRSSSGMTTPKEETVDNNEEIGPQDLDLDPDDAALRELAQSYSSARSNSSTTWLNYDKTCYIYLYKGGGDPSHSMAAFDLDGTIIKPKSNKRIPKSATDWQFFSVWTKGKLQQVLKEKQARFVIFTNQNGVGLNIVPLEEVQERIELVSARLNIPCTVFMAIDKDSFRKPNVGMYRLFEKAFNCQLSIDLENSFYCGDAIGYPSHSDADIKFAETLRLPFLTPEKFVRGVKPKLVDA